MSSKKHVFPRINYYWARDYFPNFVEEDRRVMVSYDGHLYFSALDKIDQVCSYDTFCSNDFQSIISWFQGNYSCNVHGMASDDGRNGPFFHLDVIPHPNYQQLR